jgi:flagellar hook-associated protein 1 FlgK
MSLSSASSIAQSGLNTVTAESSLLSRNITGASDTATYSRKIANVITILDGSRVASVTLASNLAVFGNLLLAKSASARQDALSAGLDTLNQTVGDVASSSSGTASGANSPAALLSYFTNALQSYEASPSSSTLATAAVTAAAMLARGLNSATSTVNQVREQADSEIATSVQTINALLAKLQPINTQIINGNATGTDVTDAQDMRDDILTKLSHEIGVTTTVSTNGDMSIYTDSGATLFQGGVARSVTFAATNTYTPATVGNVVYADGIPITGSSAAMPVATGNIAGLSNLRDTLAVLSGPIGCHRGGSDQRFRRNRSAWLWSQSAGPFPAASAFRRRPAACSKACRSRSRQSLGLSAKCSV